MVKISTLDSKTASCNTTDLACNIVFFLIVPY